MDNAPPIIIKKVKGGGEQAHHGGAWKVAYADFVTAMMAFLSCCCGCSARRPTSRSSASQNYFSPEAVSAGRSGAGGVLGGKSLAPDGAFTSIGGVAGGGIVVALPTSPGVVSEVEVDDGAEPTEAARTISQRQLDDLLAAREQQQFEEAEAILREAIQGVPELSELKNSLLVDQTPRRAAHSAGRSGTGLDVQYRQRRAAGEHVSSGPPYGASGGQAAQQDLG